MNHAPDLAELASHRWDVVVAGAGPAGSIAARAAAMAGLRVLLVDRTPFPRDKVCGCCLSAGGVGLLREAGLGELLAAERAAPLHTLALHAPGASMRLPLPCGAIIARRELDNALAHAAALQGVTFAPGVSARLLGAGRHECTIALSHDVQRVECSARVAIAADGLGGTFLAGTPGMRPELTGAARMGLGANLPSALTPKGVVTMAIGAGAYVGLARLWDGTTDLAASVSPAVLREGESPGGVIARALREAGLELPSVDIAWRGTPALRRRRAAAAPGVFVIGDAAGYVAPFTGEGMTWAIKGGLAVGPDVLRAVRGDAHGACAAWKRAHTAMFGWRHRSCAAITAVVHRPRLARALIRLGACWPLLPTSVASRVARSPEFAA